LVSQCHPDVVVTETIMPRMNGLELTGQLLRRYPDLKVLVLTRNDREDCVLRLVQAGANGYLLKTIDRSELLSAVRAVVHGGRVLQPAALETVLDDYLQRVREPSARRYCGGAHGARARGPQADRRGQHQSGHRRSAVPQPQDGRDGTAATSWTS